MSSTPTGAGGRWSASNGIVEILDADDPRLAAYAHVGDHRWLTAHGLFVAEGRLTVRRLLESRFQIESILLTPAALEGFGGAIDTIAPVFVAAQSTLHQVTGFDFHRGCLALARRPDDPPVAGRFGAARRLLALEGVGNPDNIGGLFRVAAAFDVDGLLLDPTSADPYYRKAIRTSMGAALHLPFERLETWPDALIEYRRLGFRIIALTPRAEAQALAAFAREADGPMIVLVGAEGAGLSDVALGAADTLVRIPIAAGIDSLNVTVAAGIALSYLSG
jgi:tRNA G18 (ribose-2'-O)-methylase SpoU